MGLVSAITSPIAGYYARQQQADAAAALNGQIQSGITKAGVQNTNTLGTIKNLWQPTIDTGNTALQDYNSASTDQAYTDWLKSNNIDLSKNWTQSQGALDGTGLSGNIIQDTQKFLDPSMQFRQDQGVKAMDTSAASKGGLFSGGYGKALQNYSQDLASTEYGKAYDKANTSQQNAYKNWQDRLTGLQTARTQQMAQLNNIVNYGQNATGKVGTATQEFGNNAMDLTMEGAKSQGQVDAAKKLANWGAGDTWSMIGGLGDAGLAASTMGGGSLFGKTVDAAAQGIGTQYNRSNDGGPVDTDYWGLGTQYNSSNDGGPVDASYGGDNYTGYPGYTPQPSGGDRGSWNGVNTGSNNYSDIPTSGFGGNFPKYNGESGTNAAHVMAAKYGW